ncbi:MAG: ATP-binding protein [Nanoarchaeota archaeon]|nr:ATP-binding protein [Nanoarchaeota archaeon]
MDLFGLIKNNAERARTSFSSILKIVVLLAIIHSIYFHLWRILFIDILLLILIFLPYILSKKYKIDLPTEIEFILLLFILTSFFLGEIRGLIIQIFFGLAIGFVGFTMMLLVYSTSKIKTNYFHVILFSFSFSIALGLCSEMMKYYLKIFLGNSVTITDYTYAMKSLTLVAIGAAIASFFGYIYMKGHRIKVVKELVKKFKGKNPNFFISRTDSPEEVLKLIQKGENEDVEFKSTLRTNLHTKEVDKEVEKSTLKTIVAFLNSKGGTLLIGVSDKGEITGIEKDNFQSNDKFTLHFTNLIKERIGNESFSYLDSEIVLIEGKTIMKVECIKSGVPLFLKSGKEEEFYARIGPGSSKLGGSKLIEYIKNNFKRI